MVLGGGSHRLIFTAEMATVDTEKMMKNIQTKMLLDQRRIAAIETVFIFGGGKYPELEAKAIEEGLAIEKFHTEYQQRSMPGGSRIPVILEYQSGLTPTVLEAVALATNRCSLPFFEIQYDEKTLTHIDKFRGIGIQEFYELARGGKY